MNPIKTIMHTLSICLLIGAVPIFSAQNNAKTLFDAIQEGNEQQVQDCLNQGIPIEEQDIDGFCNTIITLTPLTHAILNNHVKIVQLLLSNGANIENPYVMTDLFIGVMSLTPLTLAAQQGNLEIVQLLLDNGAQVNAGSIKYQRYDLDESGEYTACENQFVENSTHPLGAAAEAGHIEIVRLLLDNNADINAGYTDQGTYTIYQMCNQTALCRACIAGHTEIVQLLLEKNARIHDATPLITAILAEHFKIAQLLIQHNVNINAFASFIDGNETITLTPLIAAAKTGNRLMVQLLLDNNVDNPTNKTAHELITEYQEKSF